MSDKKYMREYMRKWRKKNPDAWHDYYEKNKERIRANVRKWQKEHPKKMAEYSKRQYVKRKSGKN